MKQQKIIEDTLEYLFGTSKELSVQTKNPLMPFLFMGEIALTMLGIKKYMDKQSFNYALPFAIDFVARAAYATIYVLDSITISQNLGNIQDPEKLDSLQKQGIGIIPPGLVGIIRQGGYKSIL
ncbi:MAG: hypothetical protein ACOYT4_02250 [Nanoarchaeota archaeon]